MRARIGVLLLMVAAGCLAPSTAGAAPQAPRPPVALWTAPLPGPLTVGRSFVAPPHAYGPGHRGVDLESAGGSPVLAAGDGVVVFAGRVAGRPLVSIDHTNGLRTTYEPVDPSVGAGQAVARGSPIGTLTPGHVGCAADACLHWGLRRGEIYLDPLALLLPPRVRLLPLGRPRATDDPS